MHKSKFIQITSKIQAKMLFQLAISLVHYMNKSNRLINTDTKSNKQ